MILHSGLSFFLAYSLNLPQTSNSGHELSPLVQYIFFPFLGAVLLLLLQATVKKLGKMQEEKSIENKSSKEILVDLATKLMPTTTTDSFGTRTTQGWIGETDDRLTDLAGRLTNVELNQETSMRASGIPLNNETHMSDLTKVPNPVKEDNA
jgi:hypothetical protein